MTGDGRGSAAALVAFLALLALGAGLAFAGSATAGDNVAIIDFEPQELDVEPGEEVEIDVTLISHGEYGETGVESLAIRFDYPTDYLTVTDVEPGDWFHEAPDSGAEEYDVSESVAVDDAHGAARIEQSITTRQGVIGEARVATLTVVVSEDADPATVELDSAGVEAADTEVMLTSGYPQPISTAPAELHVAGGGDVVSPAYDEDAFESDDADGESAGESADGDADATDGDAEADAATDETAATPDADAAGSDGPTDDDVPAPVGAVVLGIVVAALLFRR